MTDVTLRATKGSPLTHTEMDNNQVATRSGRKNLVIGGNFSTNPWQRGTGSTTMAHDDLLADRFRHRQVGVGVVTHDKVADSPTVAEAGILSTDCLVIATTTVDTSLATNDQYALYYKMEGHDFAQIAQRDFVVTFWHKHVKTGTHCVAFRNSGFDRSYVAEYTQAVTNTWEKATIKVTASPSAGTWNYGSSVGMQMTFCMATGTDGETTADAWNTGSFVATTSQVNNMDSTSNVMRFALIQVEEGIEATDFERRTFGEELALCQRYYEKTWNHGKDPGTATDTGRLIDRARTTTAVNHGVHWGFAVTKRTTPTVTVYSPQTGASGNLEIAASDYPASSLNAGTSGTSMDTTSTVVAGDNNFVSAHVTVDAEL